MREKKGAEDCTRLNMQIAKSVYCITRRCLPTRSNRGGNKLWLTLRTKLFTANSRRVSYTAVVAIYSGTTPLVHFA